MHKKNFSQTYNFHAKAEINTMLFKPRFRNILHFSLLSSYLHPIDTDVEFILNYAVKMSDAILNYNANLNLQAAYGQNIISNAIKSVAGVRFEDE